MIDWEKVKAYLCLKCEFFEDDEDTSLDDILYCLLDVLYNVNKMTWKEISDLTNHYVSDTTLKKKAKQLGVKMKSWGGARNFKRKITDLTKEEYDSSTNTELARKYKVCRQTVMKYAKDKGWPLKKG